MKQFAFSMEPENNIFPSTIGSALKSGFDEYNFECKFSVIKEDKKEFVLLIETEQNLSKNDLFEAFDYGFSAFGITCYISELPNDYFSFEQDYGREDRYDFER